MKCEKISDLWKCRAEIYNFSYTKIAPNEFSKPSDDWLKS